LRLLVSRLIIVKINKKDLKKNKKNRFLYLNHEKIFLGFVSPPIEILFV
jgi:hypothetical protein